MLKSSPEITVMMPTYNAAQYIDSSILSILSQRNANLKLLIYDDCSDDGTYEKVSFWANQDPRIQFTRPFSEHGHYTEICNQMIEDASSDFVARMDADDISLPNRLKLQYEFLRSRSRATLVGGMALNIVANSGHKIVDDYPWESKVIKPIASYESPANEHIRTHHRLIAGTLFARRDYLIEIGGYKDFFPIEDWELTLRAITAGGDVFILPDIMYLRRIHDRNSSKNHPNKEKAFEDINSIYNLQLAELPRSRPQNL